MKLMSQMTIALLIVAVMGGCRMNASKAEEPRLNKSDAPAHYDDLLTKLEAAVDCGAQAVQWETDPDAESGLFSIGEGKSRYTAPAKFARTSCSKSKAEFDQAVQAIEKVLKANGGVSGQAVVAAKGPGGNNEVRWRDGYGGEIVFGSNVGSVLSVRSGELADS